MKVNKRVLPNGEIGYLWIDVRYSRDKELEQTDWRFVSDRTL